MSATPTITLQARYVFPVDGPPIRDGCLTLCGERISAVDACPSENAGERINLGNAAIVPGFVNAHTHLEFSKLTAPIGEPGMPFPDWIRRVVDSRRNSSHAHVSEEMQTAVEQGLAESLRCGVTTLGEIATSGWDRAPFERSLVESTVFFELIGLAVDRIAPRLADARQHVELAANQSWRPGLSPHAPYSVHPQLFSRVAELASTANVPLAFHLAESPEELELLRAGSGPFRDLLIELGAWDASALPPGARPLNYLCRLAETGVQSLVIHGNYLDDEEIALLGANAARMAVVYCPRTHAYFGHAPHPLPRLLAAGARVALGTDSRASNPDLNLLEEMRFVFQRLGLPCDTVLRLGTLCGAAALSREAEVGSLTPGKLANAAVIALPERDAHDPHELLFDSRLPVTATLVRGTFAGSP